MRLLVGHDLGDLDSALLGGAPLLEEKQVLAVVDLSSVLHRAEGVVGDRHLVELLVRIRDAEVLLLQEEELCSDLQCVGELSRVPLRRDSPRRNWAIAD